MAMQGCFITTSFDINYWHYFCIFNPLSVFPPGIAFRTFAQHFFAEKCTLSLPDNNSRSPFPNLFPLLLPFNKPMPINYFEGIKRPCNSTGTQFLGFTREREMGDD
jgi:hypothetical protein